MKLYINRNHALDINRMNTILDAIDFWAKFDSDEDKGIAQQKMIALSI